MCWLLAIPASGRVLMMLPCMLTGQALEKIVPRYDVDAIEILPLPHIIQGKEWDEVTALIREEVKRINETLPSFKQVNKITVRKEDFKRKYIQSKQ